MVNTLSSYRFLGDRELWTSLVLFRAEERYHQINEKIGRYLRFVHVTLSRTRSGEIKAIMHMDIIHKPLVEFTTICFSAMSAIDALFDQAEATIGHSNNKFSYQLQGTHHA
jgi:hypothetical protein